MLKYKYFLILTDFYGNITDEIEEFYFTLEEAAARKAAGQPIYTEYADALERVEIGVKNGEFSESKDN